jgi:hypothetical protein
MTLFKSSHNFLNVIVQIANKIGVQKKVASPSALLRLQLIYIYI